MSDAARALVAALDEAGDREDVYARGEHRLIDAAELLQAAQDHACFPWLLLRVEATPPGHPLPLLDEAVERLFRSPRAASRADAYVVTHVGQVPSEFVVPALCNALLVSWSASGALPGRLGRAWVEAMLAMGRGAEIWPMVDGLGLDSVAWIREVIALVEPLRDHPELIADPGIAAHFRARWPTVALPALKALPDVALAVTPSVDLANLLREAGATALADEITARASRRATWADKEAHPAIRAIRQAAARGEPFVALDSAPAGAEDWLRAELRSHRGRVASVAARSLWALGAVSARTAAVGVLQDLRARDLPILLAAFGDEPDLRDEMERLSALCARLPTDVADAAVFLLVPQRSAGDPARFNEAVEHLDALAEALREGPARYREQIHAIRDARADGPEQDAAVAAADQWLRDIEARIANLRDPHSFDAPTLDRLVTECAPPSSDWRAREAARVRSDSVADERVQLVAALALARGEGDADLERAFIFRAIEVIGRLNHMPLMGLRLDLLKKLVDGPPSPGESPGQLLLMYGRTLGLLGRESEAVPILASAASSAHREGRAALEVDARLLWAEGVMNTHRAHLGPFAPFPVQVLDEVAALLDLEVDDDLALRVEQTVLQLTEGGSDAHRPLLERVRALVLARAQHINDATSTNALVSLAGALLMLDVPDDAVRVARMGLDRGFHDQGQAARLWLVVAESHLRQGDEQRAIHAFTAASEAARAFGNDALIANVEYEASLGIHRVTGLKSTRRPSLTRAREAAERAWDWRGVAELGLEEARCASTREEAHPALDAVATALKVLSPGTYRDDLRARYDRSRHDHGFPTAPESAPTAVRPAPGLTRAAFWPDVTSSESHLDLGPARARPISELEDDLRAAVRSGDLDAQAARAMDSLKAAVGLADVDALERLAQAAADCVDRVLTLAGPAPDWEERFYALCSLVAHRLAPARPRDALQWLVRSAGSARSRALVRHWRPEGVDAATWEDWQCAQQSGDLRVLEAALEQLVAASPAVLRGDVDLAGLEEVVRGGWTLVTVSSLPLVEAFPATQHVIVVVHSKFGQVRYEAAVHETGPWPAFADPAAPSDDELGAREEWARRSVAPMVERLLPDPPAQLLWCAKGPLETVPPSRLWPGVKVQLLSSPAMPPKRQVARRRSTLIVYADPGPGAPGDFQDPSLRALARLEKAGDPAPVQILAGVGARFGAALRQSDGAPHSIDAPPSPGCLLERQVEHDLIVLVGHGFSDGRRGEVQLLDRGGECVALHGEMLLETPRALAGASIVLLSCYTGRGGGLMHRPGGLVGDCLMAGAREVIAPLYAVPFRDAMEVGVALVRRFVRGVSLSQALFDLQLPQPSAGDPRGVALGPAARVEDARGAGGFVCWIG